MASRKRKNKGPVTIHSRAQADRDRRRLEFTKLNPGAQVRARVRSIQPYGAFMDLGGVEGLLHVSELSWNQVPDPHTVLKVGEVHTVKVIKVDREAERVSLSLRAMVTDPFKKLTQRLGVGHVVLGFVSSVSPNSSRG